MMKRIRMPAIFVIIACCSHILSAYEFDFQPLSSLCRIEVQISTDFGSGSIRGTFGKMSGKMNFSPESPNLTKGKINLSSRSLRFGYSKVAYDAHAPDWLNSSKYPEISFTLQKLDEFSWHGKELRALAVGDLSIKGTNRRVQIPVSVKYYRAERRKYQGRSGDLIQIQGLFSLSRSQFGLAPGDFLGSVLEDIDIQFSITGASDTVRPFLPSRLFRK